MNKRKNGRPKGRPFPDSFIVSGRNSVRASILAASAERLFLSPKRKGDPLIKMAEEKGIEWGYMEDDRLGDLSQSGNHQGYVAVCKYIAPLSLDALLDRVEGKKQALFLILDGVEDPVNLGSLLRSGDALGCDGIIMKERGQAPLSQTAAKVSTGAFNFVPIATVTNLSMAIRRLKEKGFWVVSTEMNAEKDYDDLDYDGRYAIVIGNEGFGISRLVKENSDFIVKIPMSGHVNSLNAAVSGALMLAIASLKRKGHKG